ncbi:MAG: hypothetical protein QGI60_01130 [archaeon]|jgi:hypothetical protein|nr:hypothetical protein [archaeon]
MIMKVERGASPTENDLLFYPHYATPIVMRVPAEATDEQFNAFFELVESTQPRETGANLSFWTGAGQCLDFTGIPVFEKFSNTPDREGTSNDNLVSWQFVYALDWEKVERDGEVFLKTNMYSPINGAYLIRGVTPGLGFISPDSAMAQSVELKGISGMTYNSKDAGSSVTELNELFSLVRSEQVCVTDSGSKTMFWWNPKALYDAEGEYTSMNTFESGLIAGQSCLGYSG